jgi:hypothetical protein
VKSEADAKRAIELYADHKRLKIGAAIFGEASRISVSTRIDYRESVEIQFSHLTADLLTLIGREVDLQVAIDSELAQLGFDPTKPKIDD